VVGPIHTETIDINSLRMYKQKCDKVYLKKTDWASGVSPRFITGHISVDELDKTPAHLHKKDVEDGKEVTVRVLLKYKMARVKWESGRKESIELPKLMQMIYHDYDEDEVFIRDEEQTVNQLNPDKKSFRVPSIVRGCNETVGIPAVGIVLKVDDFVVDLTQPYPNPSSKGTQYGIVRKIYPEGTNQYNYKL
jgi:hypothetical protein